jgi:arylsulfatase A-like enzyme
MIFAADHGETFGEHGIHGHARNVLTPVVWVPLVIRMPTARPAVRVGTLVRNLDLAPTVLELAGLEPPASFEGQSHLPLFEAGAEAPDRTSFASLGIPLFRDASVQSSMTTRSWTYARNEQASGDKAKVRAEGIEPGKEFLFDRSVDPGENVNLVLLEPAQAARMRAAFDDHLAGEVRADARNTDVRIDPAIADQLRAMGYLE